MCPWIGSHFHEQIDYNGVAFFNRVTRTDSQILRILRVAEFWTNGKICGKNVVILFRAVVLLFDNQLE